MSNEKTLLFWFELLRTCTVVTFSVHVFSQGVHVCVSHLLLHVVAVFVCSHVAGIFLMSFIVLSRAVYALSLTFSCPFFCCSCVFSRVSPIF